MSSRDDQLLSQYFDGELPAEEAAALRAQLAEDANLRAKLEGLEHLSTLLRTGAEAAADGLDDEDLFARITARAAEAEVDDDPMFPSEVPEDEPLAPMVEAPRPGLRVVPGGKATDREIPAQVVPPRRTGLWVIAGTALAAAAALLFFVFRGPFTGDSTGTGGDDIAFATPPPGSEVEEVDFGYSTGAIFSVEGREGEHYAVVWISDEKIEPEGEERLQ